MEISNHKILADIIVNYVKQQIPVILEMDNRSVVTLAVIDMRYLNYHAVLRVYVGGSIEYNIITPFGFITEFDLNNPMSLDDITSTISNSIINVARNYLNSVLDVITEYFQCSAVMCNTHASLKTSEKAFRITFDFQRFMFVCQSGAVTRTFSVYEQWSVQMAEFMLVGIPKIKDLTGFWGQMSNLYLV